MNRTYSFGYFHVLLISMNSTKLQGLWLAHFIFLYSTLNDFFQYKLKGLLIAEWSSWHYIKLLLNFLFNPWKASWLQRENTQAFKCLVCPPPDTYVFQYRLQLLVYCFALRRSMECWSYFIHFCSLFVCSLAKICVKSNWCTEPSRENLCLNHCRSLLSSCIMKQAESAEENRL